MKLTKLFPLAVLTAALSACGGSDSNGSSGQQAEQAYLNIQVTDAPVDDVDHVFIKFTGVEIKPNSGASIEYTFPEAKLIDLLELQQGKADSLLEDFVLDPGSYNWIRLMVQANDGVQDSYLVKDDVITPLFIPSGSETGLKLNRSFTVAAGGSMDFTLDFDLRKSITWPVNGEQAILKPVIRIVDNLDVGTLKGTVASEYLQQQNCTSVPAAYVFDGTNVAPQDIDVTESGGPITTTLLQSGETNYTFTIGFLEAGSYTLVLVCDASMDSPDDSETLGFLTPQDIEIKANETLSVLINSN